MALGQVNVPIGKLSEAFLKREIGTFLMALLISVADFRHQEGLKTTPPGDDKIQEFIEYWQPWMEKVTGNFFEKRTLGFYLDGNDSEIQT